MAALNFTLDESQSLKQRYLEILNESTQPNEDIMVALGELHEYDQEYEQARGWYYSALFLNDREFEQYVGKNVDIEDRLKDRFIDHYSPGSPQHHSDCGSVAAGLFPPPDRVPFVKAILQGDKLAKADVTLHLPWSTRRIRLLLQIGLTYEQTYDLERARSYYFTAQKLSRILTDQISLRVDVNSNEVSEDNAWFSMACDHLEVLYQPAFCLLYTSPSPRDRG